jgi:hypothetical protein
VKRSHQSIGLKLVTLPHSLLKLSVTDGKDNEMFVDDDIHQPVSSLILSLEVSLKNMDTSLLADHCMLEIDNYRRGVSSNDQFCLELLRRATVQRDILAREVLQHRLSEILLRWMRSHPKREMACQLDSEENYVAQAFENFWQATTSIQQAEFATFAVALRHLRASLNSAILETLRAYSRPKRVPLPEPGLPGESQVEDHDDGKESWETIRSKLPAMHEQRLAYLLFHCGLKPREIVRSCPQEFTDVRDVYNLSCNIVERLLRDTDHIY